MTHTAEYLERTARQGAEILSRLGLEAPDWHRSVAEVHGVILSARLDGRPAPLVVFADPAFRAEVEALFRCVFTDLRPGVTRFMGVPLVWTGDGDQGAQ